ncbi:Imm52 family immunity protein [Xenorhabdus szentirmaii]|uniref:Uncharacterized protein n=2 Tax=Xenorhabdus szentirmaii TaxID=290112 RepID=W1J4A9_9GAMM|nr:MULTISPECIES: Imm52 family immunity protein [Xenorhabdus]MBD2794419.1 immunity 52 family protein [Xenorhabdus sp. CUL]MBD2799069.1 immunity 52 family protein [Xenorhabdus sp. M]MBD2822987.1 immunity 52 family protein [Xenorhabdus sp. 42]PHM34036.1 hypothetical protein Xsze_00429 [Xenorhabdus szentirmaii DSM 16338]CDL84285.1 conserved hypothetical protein [Xenorhabdus szentirmaii DSM 16338]
MNISSLEIEVYFDWKEQLTPKLIFSDLYQITSQLDRLFGRNKTWYLPGHTRKEAILYPVFDDQAPTDKALCEFESSYKKNFPFIGKQIWDGESDDLSCSIFYQNYRVEQLGKTKISLNLNIKESEFQFPLLVEFVRFLISSRCYSYIAVEANRYTANKKKVFPDRLGAGCMIYLPTEIDTTSVPMATELLPIPDKAGNVGTLIIATKDIFDIDNKEHINKSNDIEICLRDLQLLPLIAEI